MDIGRVTRHLLIPRWVAMRAFPPRSLQAIEAAIGRSESQHRGEVVFAVEPALDLGALCRGLTARARAEQVFSDLRVWDTAENTGVLIYVLLADRDVEIVADRGIHGRVGVAGWEPVCRQMEAAFRERRFEAGVIEGILTVSALLIAEYPAGGANPNERPDRPVVLA